MKILHIDKNHHSLINDLKNSGYINVEGYKMSLDEIKSVIGQFDGIVIRSRFKIDSDFLKNGGGIKFVARVGSGIENIDIQYLKRRGIKLISAPEGNSNAVGEHALGLILSLLNNLNLANDSVKNKLWSREKFRGYEIENKTVGIVGYGNTGKSLARKLTGFNVKEIIFYDIRKKTKDSIARQVSIEELQNKCNILSIHTPQNNLSIGLINKTFIERMKNPFWLINTARGSAVKIMDLIDGIENKKILGAALDVLEYEKKSFENTFNGKIDQNFLNLIKNEKIILTPHIAGWTFESHLKLAKIIVQKIQKDFPV
ncbi:MAG: hydroxyacid dehydrogenase [Flavobacteriaceae bacterium]|nr:hydroxyacid dehydrogenase [Flavobacteriaceae bacterium]|tara:strand:+ start:149 stop:1090 length:942 start_codon:yes stop_codon:yes gene_type:complete